MILAFVLFASHISHPLSFPASFPGLTSITSYKAVKLLANNFPTQLFNIYSIYLNYLFQVGAINYAIRIRLSGNPLQSAPPIESDELMITFACQGSDCSLKWVLHDK